MIYQKTDVYELINTFNECYMLPGKQTANTKMQSMPVWMNKKLNMKRYWVGEGHAKAD